MSKFSLRLDFDSNEARDEFIGWFLDGGGEYQFGESCDVHGVRRTYPRPPDGKLWGWLIKSGVLRDEPLEEYAIRMEPAEDES